MAWSRCRSQNVKKQMMLETFRSCNAGKVHGIVAWSTFPSKHVKNTPLSENFWKLKCWKSARSCGAKHISKSKCGKHIVLGAILEVEMLKKCTQLRREAHFEVKMCKAHRSRSTFGRWSAVLCGRRTGLLKRTCKDAFRVAGAIQETCSSEILGNLRAFSSFRSSGLLIKMILRDRCSTSYDLASHGLDGMEKRQSGTRQSALHSTFHFWRKSHRIVSVLMLPTSKLKKSHRFASFLPLSSSKNWGRLPELVRFWCCQVPKLTKSRGIALFSSLQLDR